MVMWSTSPHTIQEEFRSKPGLIAWGTVPPGGQNGTAVNLRQWQSGQYFRQITSWAVKELSGAPMDPCVAGRAGSPFTCIDMAAEKWIYLKFFSPFCLLGQNASFGWIYTDGAEAAGCSFSLRLKASITNCSGRDRKCHIWTFRDDARRLLQ